ncbi:hypothetical protein KQI82_06175 [Oscillibacter sp. MSJ-2]|uniref:Uncharacterized protein n=1 Tax=Dysosmobacter acutus TaxID=2841504 RepID=A0ABS6F8A2_9FIRM|nr:hypothetical protein [Dysosmobacter acutus]MBU5626505.1 hypothetical protein [Dysosmobacter acutus]
MSNELTLYHYDAAPMSVEKKPRTGDYLISVYGCAPATLRRGVDFGMIRKKNGEAMTKYPTLFKSGAEKVAVSYGLCQRYRLESRIEDLENGFFYFLVRCDLVKIVDGTEYIITSSYGSGNTREGRTGNQSPYDGANSALKMAQKRALVSAALSLGCMSDCFTQDIESDGEEAGAYFNQKDPEAPITPQQVKFFYAAAGRHGLTKQEAKALLGAHGYTSASTIKTGEFDALLREMDQGRAD